MKLYMIFLLSIIPLLVSAQTTIEEYDYITIQYPDQIAKSKIPEKTGYYFQDLMNMVDNSGKVRLLYKESQASVIPTATLIHVNGSDKIYYICVPHDDSDRLVFDRYADDLQKLFEADEMARGNYSKIMFRYPKQIQKYYDEISALENGIEVPKVIATTVSKGNSLAADITPSKPEPPKEKVATQPTPETKPEVQPTLTAIEKPKKEPRKADIEQPKVEETPKETVTLKTIDKPTKTTTGRTSVNGIATAKVRSALAYRQLEYRPEIINETDKYGVIRVDVCVDKKGQVISARYNKSDSDTKDEDLIKISEKLAKKYTFERSHLTRQCGHIIFKFQFQ